MRRLLITVHSDDAALHGDLGENLPVNGGRALLKPAPDVVFVDAGPPAPATLPRELRKACPSAFVVLVAREVDTETLELGAELDADAFVRRDDDELADTATAVLALAAVARHGTRVRRTWTSRRKG
jgi:DNA-binding NarL/FixJ family response regulator